MEIPVVALNDNGRIVAITGEEEKQENDASITKKEAVNQEKRKLKLKNIPFSLTCILHKKYILADPTAEEESIMETLVTVVLDSLDQMVSFYKSGGNALAYSSAIKVRVSSIFSYINLRFDYTGFLIDLPCGFRFSQSCVELARKRANELKQILGEMEID